MSDIDDGGPAFPVQQTGATTDHGMSLRDWFAGQALGSSDDPLRAAETYDDVARVCYEYAHAMLRARKAERP